MIFTTAPIQAVVLLHIACNNLWTTLAATVFIYYDEVLGCSTLQTGQWLVFPPLGARAYYACNPSISICTTAADVTCTMLRHPACVRCRFVCVDAVQLLGNFATAYLESRLLRAGTPTLTIRRLMTGVGSAVSSVAVVMFGCCGGPKGATACYCLALAGSHP